MSENNAFFVCVECGEKAESVYRTYENGITKLSICVRIPILFLVYLIGCAKCHLKTYFSSSFWLTKSLTLVYY